MIDRDCSVRGRKQRLLAHYDTDGDGALSDEERALLREDFGAGRRGRPHIVRKLRREMLTRLYDADRSGDPDEDEKAELSADLEARCEARQAQVLAKYDADSSGDLSESEREAFAKLDADERLALVEELKSRVRGEHFGEHSEP